MKRLNLTSLALLWLLAVPAFAGVVYVPYTHQFQLGGTEYQTWVWASNNHGENLGIIKYSLIPSFQDGTEREDSAEPIQIWIGPQKSRIVEVEGQRGMLEIEASSEVYIQARLVPVSDGLEFGQGIDLPIISSDNLIPANEKVQLLGFERREDGAAAYSSFGLVNLGKQGTECKIDAFDDDGTAILEDFDIGFVGLSHNHFDNVLAILGQTEGSEWRMAVWCDQPFFPYRGVFYPQTGQLTFATPAASGQSLLSLPSDTGISEEFEYLSDLPILRYGGLELYPLIDSSGMDFHGGSNGNTTVGGFTPIRILGTAYEKGISFYGKWSQTPFVEFELGGQYALFTAIVRLDDYANGRYEWAIVQNDRWVRLERPSDGFRGVERSNPIRVSGAATFSIIGDGQVLFASDREVYAYGDPVIAEVDVTGVQTLRLQMHYAGHERVGAPHRNGLSSDRMVNNCPWWDLISFADTKLYLTE